MLKLHLGLGGAWVGFLERNSLWPRVLPSADIRGQYFLSLPLVPLSLESSVTTYKAQGSCPSHRGNQAPPSLFERKAIMFLLSFNVQQRERN